MIFGPPALFVLLFAISPDASLDLAERLHRAKQYEFAAAIYDSLEGDQMRSPLFYHVKGNAHFLAGHMPQSILAYRQALRAWPTDRALLENLADARSRVVDSPGHEELDGFRSLSPWGFVIAAFGTYLCGWTMLFAWVSAPRSRVGLIAGIEFLASIILMSPLLLVHLSDDPRPIAVVAEDATALRRGNGLSYEPVEHAGQMVRLNRGVEARVRSLRPNGWVQLELANGVIGWAPQAQLLLERASGP